MVSAGRLALALTALAACIAAGGWHFGVPKPTS
jgi:hypothetical protein